MKNILTRASAMMPLLFVAACNTTASNDPSITGSISQPNIEAGNAFQRGTASWYGPGFNGKRAASGEVFNENAMTAAHRSLPFGTKVTVTDQRTGNQVQVRINDRGPFHGSRIIDLSKAAATQLGFRNRGTTSVQAKVSDAHTPPRSTRAS